MKVAFVFAILLLGHVGSNQPLLAAAETTPTSTGPSGNPLPRFVAIGGSTANMRTGPGLQYPIVWVYKRATLPMEIIDEHGPWRQVRDHQGAEGWMHVKLFFPSKRFAMIRGKTRTLYSEKDRASPKLLTAEVGVIGKIDRCEDIWCQLTIAGRQAWIERRHLWGVYKNEVLD